MFYITKLVYRVFSIYQNDPKIAHFLTNFVHKLVTNRLFFNQTSICVASRTLTRARTLARTPTRTKTRTRARTPTRPLTRPVTTTSPAPFRVPATSTPTQIRGKPLKTLSVFSQLIGYTLTLLGLVIFIHTVWFSNAHKFDRYEQVIESIWILGFGALFLFIALISIAALESPRR